jgi:hypothetical protein
VTLTAAVSVATPTGTVFFLDGSTILGIASVDTSGHATLDVTLSAGPHTLVAIYAGDVNYVASVSNFVSQVVSTDGPRVTDVQRFGYHAMPTSLVLTFSRSLDPTRAQDVHNYRIVNLGGPGRDGNLVGQRIRVRSAIYDPATLTVTLYPAEQLDVHNFYRLTVVGTGPNGLTDKTGFLLDGVGKGQPGSNFVAVISRKTLAGPAPAPKPLAVPKAVVSLPGLAPFPTVAAGSQWAGTPRVVQSLSTVVVDILADSGHLTAASAHSKGRRRN